LRHGSLNSLFQVALYLPSLIRWASISRPSAAWCSSRPRGAGETFPPHPTPCTPHPSTYNLHPTPHTLHPHPTPCIPGPNLETQNPKPSIRNPGSGAWRRASTSTRAKRSSASRRSQPRNLRTETPGPEPQTPNQAGATHPHASLNPESTATEEPPAPPVHESIRPVARMPSQWLSRVPSPHIALNPER
jgi:hypothetical protein